VRRPGPDERLLTRLRWPLRQAVLGKDPGGWRSTAGGDGLEIATVREYNPGDDVRRINWTAAARTGRLQVVVPVAERALNSRIVLDASASMTFGSIRSKFDVALEATETLNRIASRHADRVQIIAVNDTVITGTAHQGRAAALGGAALLDRLEAHGNGPLTQVISDASTVRGGLLIVVSDFRDPATRSALQLSCRRGAVIAVVVHDPHEREIPDVGLITVRDPETGQVVQADTSDPVLRERFSEGARQLRDDIAASTSGAVVVVDVCTDGPHGGTQVVTALLAGRKARR
jgi:uncharacterized protein (DUF58 family)